MSRTMVAMPLVGREQNVTVTPQERGNPLSNVSRFRPPVIVDADFTEVKRPRHHLVSRSGSNRFGLVILGGLCMYAIGWWGNGWPEKVHHVSDPIRMADEVDLYVETLKLNSAIGAGRVVVQVAQTLPDRSIRAGELCETSGQMLRPHQDGVYTVSHEFVASGRNCKNGVIVRRLNG